MTFATRIPPPAGPPQVDVRRTAALPPSGRVLRWAGPGLDWRVVLALAVYLLLLVVVFAVGGRSWTAGPAPDGARPSPSAQPAPHAGADVGGR